MSLGIALKGSEGVVLAADSRVTLNAQVQLPNSQKLLLPATFDNATKLLKVKGQNHVGAITYGVGAIGLMEPRTAHSFIPELEAQLPDDRLSVENFARKLSEFFLIQWDKAKMPNPALAGQDMAFLIGGYDDKDPYGRVFEFFIPSRPNPREAIPSGQFGGRWGGQHQTVDRLLNGLDPATLQIVRESLHIEAPQQGQVASLEAELRTKLSAKIPWQFLPLQDCVDLAIFLIKATITLQKWTVDIRGVGGAVDVATITRSHGFKYIQQKEIIGEVVKKYDSTGI